MRSPPGGDTAPMMLTERDRAAERLHPAGSLVEVRQRGGQPRRVALFGGQLAGPRGELAQRLGPPRGRVRDDDHVVAHVAVVARPPSRPCRCSPRAPSPACSTCWRSAPCARAAGRPCAGPRAASNSSSTSAISLPRSPQPTYTITVGVAPLRDLLEQHGLARSETAGHGRGAAVGDRVQQVEHTLTGDQAVRRRQPRLHRPRSAHRPAMRAAGPRRRRRSRSPRPRPIRRLGDPLDDARRRAAATSTRCSTASVSATPPST